MNLNKELILEKYLQKVNKITDECDWKTHFTAEECVSLVCKVIEEINEENNNDFSSTRNV